ncbi:hypothetical protein F0562_003719 [Nyssa sinensis]|uniref:TRF2/HOY1 PH-like domain-containing protein n=1 Tax=Nyssa sinensis TaxID=561372 RepID=A0A5J5C0H2_9ASTE|nr:hypothetical protein F0562_003719 [Nyssa sinensis]
MKEFVVAKKLKKNIVNTSTDTWNCEAKMKFWVDGSYFPSGQCSNSKHEGDLITKCYYGKRKLVWEVLKGALKSKIEIQWSAILAIRAITVDDEPGILEIELNQPPLFYRETNPQPRKHTL